MFLRRFTVLTFPLLLIALISCEEDEEPITPSPPAHFQYLHLSHTETNMDIPLIDDITAVIDYSQFDMLWLGGDLTSKTSANDAVMNVLDSLFDLGNPNTLWSVGNHDYQNVTRIKEFTGRSTFYTYHKNGLTFVVLDTQKDQDNIFGEQRELLESVMDTIQRSSHLILLHHKLIWMFNHPLLGSQINDVSNGNFGTCVYCLRPNNFQTEIYPQLVEVRNRGIEVLCIGGDLGGKTDEFEFTTNEDIHFLASGILAKNQDNKALLFSHDTIDRAVRWEYRPLTSFLLP